MSCKYILSFLCILIFTGCHSKISHSKQNDVEIDPSLVKGSSTAEEHIINIYFLGHQINCKDKDFIKEFYRICEDDSNLSFDSISGNIDIYGTIFHLNYNKIEHNSFMLISSVQPDTKQIKKVREAIGKFHGKENFEEDCHYSWSPFMDSTMIGNNYPVIHLKRVRSEEGGTAIIVF